MDGERIRVEVVRSGGFAGITRRAAADTADLDDEQARSLAALLEPVDLDALGEAATEPTPDAFTYRLVVMRGEERRQAMFAEAQVTPEVRALLDRVLARG